MKGYSCPKSVKPDAPVVWLQGLGWVVAKPAKDLLIGEDRVYNYGYRYVIKAVVNDGKWVHLTVVNKDGKYYTERKRPNTLVPYQPPFNQIQEEVRQNLIKGAQ